MKAKLIDGMMFMLPESETEKQELIKWQENVLQALIFKDIKSENTILILPLFSYEWGKSHKTITVGWLKWSYSVTW